VNFILTEQAGCRGNSCGDSVTDFAVADISSGGDLYLDADRDIINNASYIGGYGSGYYQ